ncbi:MAG: WG repeat-containing protein [Clostridioides sp.]|jgi:hypothetical protein|nr:WG repeat-containing protein [Clostridioides sp.]
MNSSDRKNYGYINKKGEFEIKPQFKILKDVYSLDIVSASNGLIFDTNEYYEFKEGLAMISTTKEFDNSSIYNYGYIDKKGNISIDVKYSYASVFGKEKKCLALVHLDDDSEYGRSLYINKNDEIVFECPSLDNVYAKDLEELQDPNNKRILLAPKEESVDQ